MLVLYLGNAVLGGISVLVKLAWVSVMGHFLLAIALVAVALGIHKRASEPDGPRVLRRVRPRCVPRARRLRLHDLGAGARDARHRGRPARRRRRGQASQLADHRPRARARGLGRRARRCSCSCSCVVLVHDRAPRRVLTTVSVVLAAMVAQGILGYVQYAQGIPELLVGFHVAGAVLVFGSVHGSSSRLRVPVDPVAARSSADARARARLIGPPVARSGRGASEHGPTTGTVVSERRGLRGSRPCTCTSSTAPTSCSGSTSRRGPATSTPTASRSAATRAVVTIVLGMLEDGATHLGVATDHVIESFRNDLWADYKTGEGIDPLLCAVPAARGRAARARRRRSGRWSSSKPTTRSRARPRVAAADDRGRAGDHLHARQGPRAVRRRQGRAARPAHATILLDADGVQREVRRAARVDPRLARARRRQRRRLPRPPGFGREDGGRGARAATATSRRSPTTPRRGTSPGVRGVDRLAATLAAGRDVADLFKVLATLRTDADVGTVDDWDWTGPTPELRRLVRAVRLAATRPTRADAAGRRNEESIVVSDAVRDRDRCGPGIAQVTLNRPERLNAMNHALGRRALRRARRRSRPIRSCRVIVLTGAGRGFCAGLDLTEGASPPAARASGRAAGRHDRAEVDRGLVPKMRSVPQPIIAAVNGAASGGGLALALGERRPHRGRERALQRRVHPRRAVGLRHRRVVDAAPPHRRVPRVRAAAHRPAHRRGRSRPHRARHPGRARRRRSSTPRSRPRS